MGNESNKVTVQLVGWSELQRQPSLAVFFPGDRKARNIDVPNSCKGLFDSVKEGTIPKHSQLGLELADPNRATVTNIKVIRAYKPTKYLNG